MYVWLNGHSLIYETHCWFSVIKEDRHEQAFDATQFSSAEKIFKCVCLNYHLNIASAYSENSNQSVSAL